MLNIIKGLLISSIISFIPGNNLSITNLDKEIENTMVDEMDLLKKEVNQILPDKLQLANVTNDLYGFKIYLNNELDLNREELDLIHTTVLDVYCFKIFSENGALTRGRPTYENVYGSPVRKTFSGYAGNQPSGGNRFATGGGFYYSDSGGPTVSLSIAFPVPYNTMTVGVSLGNVSSSGKFVTVPDTINYYKLFVEKTFDCKPYITYYTNSLGQTSVFFKGTTQIFVRQNQYAKRV